MKVALIGTGLMGGPMGERLLETGHDLTVYNRTETKTRRLRELGATVASTPLEAISSAELTLLMLSDAAAIRETIEPHGRLPSLSDRTRLLLELNRPPSEGTDRAAALRGLQGHRRIFEALREGKPEEAAQELRHEHRGQDPSRHH